jgi:hypothetical protein
MKLYQWINFGCRWIKLQDLHFKRQDRKICLLIDNFSGHDIAYEPDNIHLEFFEPNMTSFVQPLDAGIIRCFKAHYRRAFCERAIELDEAGEDNIYKIDLLEVILMAKEAWRAISPKTIKNCWAHAQIHGSVQLLFVLILLSTILIVNSGK